MRKNLKSVIPAIVLIIIPLTIGGLFLKFGHTFPVQEDAMFYDAVAKNLLQGNGLIDHEGLALHVNVPPGYPVFLASVFKVFGYNYNAVRMAQFLLLGGIGVLTWLIARKFLKPCLAFFAALVVVLWPYFILYSTLLLTEVLFCFLFLFAIYFFMKRTHSPTLLHYILGGVLLVLATLVKFTTLLLPFWLIVLALLFKKKKYAVRLLSIIAIFTLLTAPWVIYNSVSHSRIPQPFIEDGKAYSSVNFFSAETLKSWVQKMPPKLLFFWNPGAGGLMAEKIKQLYPPAGHAMSIYRILAILTMLAGAVSLFFERKKTALFWAVILYFWLLHTVIAAPANPRYALPLIPLITILAAVTLQNVLKFLPAKTPTT